MDVLTNLIVVIIFHSIYMYHNITLYILNLHSDTCYISVKLEKTPDLSDH